MFRLEEEIRVLLEEIKSKAQLIKFIDWIGNDEHRMEALMQCYFSNNLRLCQKASWPLIYINAKSPELLTPYLERMVAKLDNPLHDAVIRNTVRIFKDVKIIPESIEGDLLEKCFLYINDPKRPGAIRAFSISVATNLCEKYPELKTELIYSLEEHYDHSTKAFQASARNALKKLK